MNKPGVDVGSLTKHLEKYRNKKSSKIVPDRHKGKESAYFSYVDLEIKRTELKIFKITGVEVKK